MKHVRIYENEDALHAEKNWRLLVEYLEKFKPYAEEGITYDELEILSRSKKNKLAHKDFAKYQQTLYTSEWNPELIIRINGLLTYLVLKSMQKTYKEDSWTYTTGHHERFITFRDIRLWWVIKHQHHEVHVTLRDEENGDELKSYSFNYIEVSNPIRAENQRKFDL